MIINIKKSLLIINKDRWNQKFHKKEKRLFLKSEIIYQTSSLKLIY